jgi:hypothetical protein
MESGRRSKHSSRDIVKFRGGLREVIRSDERSHMTAGGNCSTDIETDPERSGRRGGARRIGNCRLGGDRHRHLRVGIQLSLM